MSRIHYNDELSPSQLGLQIGRELRTIQGNQSQAFLRALEQYLLTMHPKRLIENVLCDENGEVCVLGLALERRLVQRGMTYAEAELILDPRRTWDEEDWDSFIYAAKELGVSETLAWLLMEANEDDEFGPKRTPEERYVYVLKQVRKMLKGELSAVRLP